MPNNIPTDKSHLKERLEAIQNGKYTDSEFLVGPENGEQEKMYAVKAMMMISSPFMEAMFNSSMCPAYPIQFKYITPKIFKLIIEHVHLGQLVTSPLSYNDAVQLAIAADHFLMKPLREICTSLIKSLVTLENVWSILNSLLKYNLVDIATACHELLQEKTIDCLEHATFLTASTASLNELLKLETLNITSEGQLVNCCWIWAEQQPDPKVAIRSVLSNLRVLTLSSKMIGSLLTYLTEAEKVAIFEYNYSPKNGNPLNPLPATLCARSDRRTRPGLLILSQKLMPSSLIIADVDHMPENEMWNCEYDPSNYLTICPKKDIYVTGISGLCLIHGPTSIEYNNEEGAYQKIPKMSVYDGTVSVTIQDDEAKEFTLEDVEYNSTWSVKFAKPTLVFKDKTCRIQVQLNCADEALVRDICDEEVADGLVGMINTADFKSILVQGGVRQIASKDVTDPVFLHKFDYIVKK